MLEHLKPYVDEVLNKIEVDWNRAGVPREDSLNDLAADMKLWEYMHKTIKEGKSVIMPMDESPFNYEQREEMLMELEMALVETYVLIELSNRAKALKSIGVL